MNEKSFNVVKIDQNGKKIITETDLTAFVACKLCRERNKALRLNNPHKIKKYATEEATE